MTSARIISNWQVFGDMFAIEQEAKRLMRKGYSRHLAFEMGVGMVMQVLRTIDKGAI